jgi:hypothetical protein
LNLAGKKKKMKNKDEKKDEIKVDYFLLCMNLRQS